MTVDIEKNENDTYRGLHIVIIHPKTGNVEYSKAFDTYKSSNDLDGLLMDLE